MKQEEKPKQDKPKVKKPKKKDEDVQTFDTPLPTPPKPPKGTV